MVHDILMICACVLGRTAVAKAPVVRFLPRSRSDMYQPPCHDIIVACCSSYRGFISWFVWQLRALLGRETPSERLFLDESVQAGLYENRPALDGQSTGGVDTPGFMVNRKTQPIHLGSEAVSVRQTATRKADRREAADVRCRAALQPVVTNFPSPARNASMARVSDAFSGAQARPDLFRDPREQAYHPAYAAGIGSRIGESISILYDRATQSGVKFSYSAPSEVPNADVIWRGIHKRLQ